MPDQFPMLFDPDLAPAMRNRKEKNRAFLAQARLRNRNPAGEADWDARYAERFAALFKTDDAFQDLVNGATTNEALARMQERLDQPS